MVMIKDNHISVAGGIANAMRLVDQYLEKEKLTVPVEVLVSARTICLCIHTIVFHLFV
jgi:nicotinate-nucleotide pyrophosphorylase